MATEQTIESNEKRVGADSVRPETELAIGGMTCGNCVRHVTEALQNVPGVSRATVSLEAQQARVRWEADAEPNPAAGLKAVEAAGYEARMVETQGSIEGVEALTGWRINLWVGVLGTSVMMIGEWVFRLGMVRWFQWFSFIVASVVQVIAGASFYRGAWRQLKAGSSNMDTLVALGSTTAFAYTTWALFSRFAGHLYFMEAAAIITLVSMGHWMESRVSVRASGALQ